jgi:hypothetical protein
MTNDTSYPGPKAAKKKDKIFFYPYLLTNLPPESGDRFCKSSPTLDVQYYLKVDKRKPVKYEQIT